VDFTIHRLTCFNSEWYGKAGRGVWCISRQATASKVTVSVSIQYIRPTISEDTWNALLQERNLAMEGVKEGDIEREGQAWTGDAAEAFAREREREKEETVSPTVGEKEKETRQGRPRKAKTPSSISTSSISGTTGSDISPTSSYFSHSPVRTFSLLTPPNSEGSLSNMVFGGISESAGSESSVHDNFRDLAALGRKRAPSEPGVLPAAFASGRSRSATASSGNGYGSKNSGSYGTSANGGKSGRGRGGGGGSGRDGKKRTTSNGNVVRGRGGNYSANSGSTRGRKISAL
jgi:hypothetical protein